MQERDSLPEWAGLALASRERSIKTPEAHFLPGEKLPDQTLNQLL
jgi:hypothetical protein